MNRGASIKKENIYFIIILLSTIYFIFVALLTVSIYLFLITVFIYFLFILTYFIILPSTSWIIPADIFYMNLELWFVSPPAKKPKKYFLSVFHRIYLFLRRKVSRKNLSVSSQFATRRQKHQT